MFVVDHNKILSPNYVDSMPKKTLKNLQDNLSECLEKRELLISSG